MDTAQAQPRRWTRAEYDQLVGWGFFQDERLELLDGEIVTMTPQRSPHATAVIKGQKALEQAFGVGYMVRPQLPLATDPLSEPEPDLAVVPGEPDDYPEHPISANLVVEIADSSLRLDRQRKGPLYARAGIADYWIVNLVDRVVEVYREPVEGAEGWHYRLIRAYTPGESVAPLTKPDHAVAISDMLPKS
ncbi:MAG: Uma2 family endonuclease [Candidatus Sericytochromatia bacterium]|nr:Uma2 family endonuclease [Candidatus Sericytochromatia bacterium]